MKRPNLETLLYVAAFLALPLVVPILAWWERR
jgi:hypothetical protein